MKEGGSGLMSTIGSIRSRRGADPLTCSQEVGESWGNLGTPEHVRARRPALVSSTFRRAPRRGGGAHRVPIVAAGLPGVRDGGADQGPPRRRAGGSGNTAADRVTERHFCHAGSAGSAARSGTPSPLVCAHLAVVLVLEPPGQGRLFAASRGYRSGVAWRASEQEAAIAAATGPGASISSRWLAPGMSASWHCGNHSWSSS